MFVRELDKFCSRGDFIVYIWKMNRNFLGRGGGNFRNRERDV